MADGQISNGSEAYAWKLVGELRQQLKWLTRSDRDAAQRIVNEFNEMYLGWWDQDAARGQAQATRDHTG